MSTDGLSAASAKKLSAYAPYTSVKNGLQVFKDQLIPDRIDRSVWGNKFSGSLTTQVLSSLRFLGAINKDGVPQDTLRDLVAAIGTKDWAPTLRLVVETAYAPIFELDLEKASPSQFLEKFREVYGADGETGRKCTTFFLNAAREAAIPISPYLLKNTKPRGGGVSKRRARPKSAAAPRAPESEEKKHGDERFAKSMTDRLLEKFPEFDPSWDEDLKKEWFAGFSELMGRTKGDGGS